MTTARVAMLVLALSVPAFRHTYGQTTIDPALVVFPGALDVRRTNELDGAVDYSVDDPYPGGQVIAWIGETLRKLEWEEKDLKFEGDTPGGVTRAWSHYLEGEKDVFAWVGSWRNRPGDYVTYWLRYETQGAHARAVRMHVTARRMSAAKVRQMQQFFEKR